MYRQLILTLFISLIILRFSAVASYYPEAFRIINSNELICFIPNVNSIYYIPTVEESRNYNSIEKKLLNDLSNLIFLYDLPIIFDEEEKDYSKCNIILAFIFKYDDLALSANCCGYPYYTSLKLIIKPEKFLKESSPLAVLDYILIWENSPLTNIGLTSSTGQSTIYTLARDNMRRSMELFAIFYKRAKNDSK